MIEFHAKIPPEVLAALKLRAAAEGVTLSVLVRRAFVEFLALSELPGENPEK
jgi:predicted HicB family RNase H-like nuclease